MEPKMDPCIKIPLEPEVLNDIVEKAKDFCLMHGMFTRDVYIYITIYTFKFAFPSISLSIYVFVTISKVLINSAHWAERILNEISNHIKET